MGVVAIVIGVIYGATSGYLGGRVDLVMMRIVDILYSLPFIFFVIMLVVFFGRNFILMFIAVGAVEWLDMARIVRGQTLSIKRQEYVQAAEALEHANLAVEKGPRVLEVRETRGQILAALGRSEEALPDLEAALGMRRVPVDLHKTLAKVYDELGNPQMAARHRERAAEKMR